MKAKQKEESELIVFVKIKDLVSCVLLVSSKSPVKYRYSILNPLITACLFIIELLYETNDMDFSNHRLEMIRQAKTKLKTVDFLSSVASDGSCFTKKQYEVILTKIGIASKNLTGF